MTKTPKRPRDVSQLAKMMVDIATSDAPMSDHAESQNQNKAAVALGRLGGKARAVALSPERRKEIAKKARASKRASTDA